MSVISHFVITLLSYFKRWNNMKILVTGGTGYIGSHTCVELLNQGHEVVIFDNLFNSQEDVVDKIERITGKRPVFYKADMLDKESMRPIFENHTFDAVIHFAGLKAVGESVQKPLWYYQNNITGTLKLCELMNEYGCKRMIFSSSATVYGSPETVPITEDFPLSTTNPYGSTKLMLEQILSDFCVPAAAPGVKGLDNRVHASPCRSSGSLSRMSSSFPMGRE